MSDRQIADLAHYLRQIIGTPEEKRARLASLRKRGAIPGLYIEAGGIDDDERQTCCDPADHGVVVDNPDANNPWSGTDGNAPPGYMSTPDGVTDCETGAPISVNFVGGFSQPETCKECGPDPSWKPGYFWRLLVTGEPPRFAGLEEAWEYTKQGIIGFQYETGREWFSPDYVRISYVWAGGAPGSNDFRQFECGGDLGSHCTTSEAPEVCGSNWTADNSTQYVLRNGCFVASKCDPDASAAALGCNNELLLCMDGTAWKFRPTADGGWVQYDPTGVHIGGKYDRFGGLETAVQPGQEYMY